jgi:heterodisulfide reductase subunit A
MATGFELTPLNAKKEYGGGILPNVIDPLMMERFLAPTGPYGRVLRPGDGKEPTSIAYVQCAGSRDKTLNIEYCSRVCCMYAIKQAMLLNGALPCDIRFIWIGFGKVMNNFQNAQAMGIEFVRGKVASIREDESQNPIVKVELTEEGRIVERTHDLVVLSLGMVPSFDPRKTLPISVANDGFIDTPSPNEMPCGTTHPGIFVTGAAISPMDIVDSIVTASAAAATVSAYIQDRKNNRVSAAPPEHKKEAIYA